MWCVLVCIWRHPHYKSATGSNNLLREFLTTAMLQRSVYTVVSAEFTTTVSLEDRWGHRLGWFSCTPHKKLELSYQSDGNEDSTYRKHNSLRYVHDAQQKRNARTHHKYLPACVVQKKRMANDNVIKSSIKYPVNVITRQQTNRCSGQGMISRTINLSLKSLFTTRSF